MLYSKLRSKNWPRPAYVLKKLIQKVERGDLIVQLYDDDETKVTDEEKPVRFEELKVKLVCQFSNTKASEQLKADVARIEGGRKDEQRMKHYKILEARERKEVARAGPVPSDIKRQMRASASAKSMRPMSAYTTAGAGGQSYRSPRATARPMSAYTTA